MAKKKPKGKKAPAKKLKAAKRITPNVVSLTTKAGLNPLGDRVLVKPMSPEEGMTTSFGIIIPDTAKEKPEQGVVVAVGPGRRGDDNELVPMQVMVGDKVMFSKYGYDEVKVDGTEYYIIREESILAVINK